MLIQDKTSRWFMDTLCFQKSGPESPVLCVPHLERDGPSSFLVFYTEGASSSRVTCPKSLDNLRAATYQNSDLQIHPLGQHPQRKSGSALSLLSVTLNKFLTFLSLSFPYLQKETDNNALPLRLFSGLCREGTQSVLATVTFVEGFRACPAFSRVWLSLWPPLGPALVASDVLAATPSASL